MIIASDRRLETKQGIEGKMLGSDWEELGLGIRIADLNLTPCILKYLPCSC